MGKEHTSARKRGRPVANVLELVDRASRDAAGKLRLWAVLNNGHRSVGQ